MSFDSTYSLLRLARFLLPLYKDARVNFNQAKQQFDSGVKPTIPSITDEKVAPAPPVEKKAGKYCGARIPAKVNLRSGLYQLEELLVFQQDTKDRLCVGEGNRDDCVEMLSKLLMLQEALDTFQAKAKTLSSRSPVLPVLKQSMETFNRHLQTALALIIGNIRPVQARKNWFSQQRWLLQQELNRYPMKLQLQDELNANVQLLRSIHVTLKTAK